MPYNVSIGGNTANESEILEPIHACLRELAAWDKAKKSHLLKYTDDDIVAATMLYIAVVANRLIHTLSEEQVNAKYSKEIVENYAENIRQLTEAITRVNVTNHFKENKE